jgi:hypothetical protein
MGRHISGGLLLLVLSAWTGCCSTCPAHRVPVSLEPLYNFSRYYSVRCAWHYPFSCPPCPYPGPGTVGWSLQDAAPREHKAEPEPLLPAPADSLRPQPEEPVPDPAA